MHTTCWFLVDLPFIFLQGLREPNSDEPAASKAGTLGVLALPAPMVGRQHLVTLLVNNQPPHSITVQ